jgi:hypothetical protein
LFGVAADAMVLAFRGTLPIGSVDSRSSIADWINDADAVLVEGANLPGRVHQGFRNALDALWPDLQPVLAAALADPANAQKPLYVTGHSKGGSMAFLAAARIVATLAPLPPQFPTRVQCITFAAARPGDGAFATDFDALVPHAVRYEYQNDIVPHVPPGGLVATALRALPNVETKDMVNNDLFVSPAALTFFDWSDQAQQDSVELQIARAGHLITCLAAGKFDEIVHDHAIADTSGYARDVFALP